MLISIQLLRGFAALLVVLHHTMYKESIYGVDGLGWLHIGASGVDLFFIISGFIMCYATHNKNVSFTQFILLRIERIVPLYWVFTTLALAVYLIYPQVVNSSGGHTSALASYFLIPSGDKYLVQNGWTLSYEFYYYFIFSFFIFATANRFLRYVGVTATLTGLATIGLLLNTSSHALNFLFSDWLYEFAMGVIAYCIYKSYNVSKGVGLTLIITGVAILVFKNNHMNAFASLPGAFIVGVPMWFIFVGVITFESYLKNKSGIILNFGVLLGYSSYSLYLAHPFVLSPMAMILKKLHLDIDYLFGFGLILSSITVGILSYQYLEKPLVAFLKGKLRRKTSRVT
jgi:peptidoglycan/LPS O-acetylase OafA/YrhL